MLGYFHDLLDDVTQTGFVEIHILWPEVEYRDFFLAQDVNHYIKSPNDGNRSFKVLVFRLEL